VTLASPSKKHQNVVLKRTNFSLVTQKAEETTLKIANNMLINTKLSCT